MAAAFGQISEADLETMTTEQCTNHIRLYKAQRELVDEFISQGK